MSFLYIYDNNYNLKYANSEPIYAIDLITEEERYSVDSLIYHWVYSSFAPYCWVSLHSQCNYEVNRFGGAVSVIKNSLNDSS